jgi:hypothetical protein
MNASEHTSRSLLGLASPYGHEFSGKAVDVAGPIQEAGGNVSKPIATRDREVQSFFLPGRVVRKEREAGSRPFSVPL